MSMPAFGNPVVAELHRQVVLICSTNWRLIHQVISSERPVIYAGLVWAISHAQCLSTFS